MIKLIDWRACAGVAALLSAGGAFAQFVPPDLSDLVGARAGQAEGEFARRGFRFAGAGQGSSYSKVSNWWNPRTRVCARVVTSDGRYSAITAADPRACGQAGTQYVPNEDHYLGDYNAPNYGYPNDAYRPPVGGYLTLICYGEGRKPGGNISSGYAWNPRTNRFDNRLWVDNGQQRFGSEVQIVIENGRGRIHLEGRLVPPINSGGYNGWWELRNLVVGPSHITGYYKVNGLNKPQVSIDRSNGRLHIDGIEKFRGNCDTGNWRGLRF